MLLVLGYIIDYSSKYYLETYVTENIPSIPIICENIDFCFLIHVEEPEEMVLDEEETEQQRVELEEKDESMPNESEDNGGLKRQVSKPAADCLIYISNPHDGTG